MAQDKVETDKDAKGRETKVPKKYTERRTTVPKAMEELRRDAQQGNLSRNDVTVYLTRGWIADSEAEELDSLILEQSPVPAPTQQPTRRLGCLRLDWIPTIVSALAGLGAGAQVAATIEGDAGACALPVLSFLGLIGGLFVSFSARKIRFGGKQIGIVGAMLLVLLSSCSVSQIARGVDSISNAGRLRRACLAKKESGLPLPDYCKKELELTEPAAAAKRSMRTVAGIALTIVSIAIQSVVVLLIIRWLTKRGLTGSPQNQRGPAGS